MGILGGRSDTRKQRPCKQSRSSNMAWILPCTLLCISHLVFEDALGMGRSCSFFQVVRGVPWLYRVT